MRSNKRKPLAKFRIYTWRSVLFYHVYIWKTLKDLRAEYDSNKNNKESSNGVEGFCRQVSRYKVIGNTHKITPKVGEIHLAVKYLTTDRITHECTHAAIKVLNRLSIDFNCLSYGNQKNEILIEKPSLNGEEFLCYIVGSFSKQIVNRIYKLKFLVESTSYKAGNR